MKILAIDTATEILSVAYVGFMPPVRVSHDIATGLRHSELLVPAIRTVLEHAGCTIADIDAIACMNGPGSFTGLRIGIATAKGITAGSGVPLVTVPTLDVYAEPFHGMARIVVPVIDAKKRRFYSAIFVDGRRVTDDADLPPEKIIDTIRAVIEAHEEIGDRDGSRVLIVGPHAGLFLTVAPMSLGSRLFAPRLAASSALSLATLARGLLASGRTASDETAPVYLRESEARLPGATRTHAPDGET